jgi:hypothetical protein
MGANQSTAMFVRDFLHVGQPFESVAPRFVSDTAWLAPIAEEAAAVAREVAVSVLGTGQPGPVPPGPVRCEIGPARVRASSLLIPVWLLSEGPDTALPDLAGDLEVAPVGAHRSLIAFGATYQRPTRGPQALARVERATEAGVRQFLNGIAVALGHPASRV